MEPRSAAAAGKDFPYTARTTCYIEVHEDGAVTHGNDRAAHERALAGQSRLFAVWPGEWSSHLFVIDDLDEYAKAHGIKHDEERTGLTEHVHDVRWEKDPCIADHANHRVRKVALPKRAGLPDSGTVVSWANVRSRLRRAVQRESTKDGAEIHQSLATPRGHQQWRLVVAGQDNGETLYTIENVRSGKVLEILGAHETAGAVVAQRAYEGDDAHHQQ